MTINTDYDSVIDMVLGYPSYEVIFALNVLYISIFLFLPSHFVKIL